MLNTSVPCESATSLTTGRFVTGAALVLQGEAGSLRSMTSQAQLEVSHV